MSFKSSNGLHFVAIMAWMGVLSLSAQAYSARVQSACRGDYFAHCSQFSVGTPEVAQCMRRVGEGLSLPCLAALADDGQISKAEIDAYYARQQAKAGQAPKPGAAPKAVAAAKAKPLAKAASLAKTPKTAKAANSVTAAKSQKSVGPSLASAKTYDAPESGDGYPKKAVGKRYSSDANNLREPKADQKVYRVPPQKSVRQDDDTVVAKNTKRRPRDDDGWYDDNYFGDRGYSRFASGYASRGADYGPPDPYLNPRDPDEYRR